jgi:hypothetical protein
MRIVLTWHRLFSMLLAWLSAYALVVSLFAVAYFVLGFHYTPHPTLAQAFLEIITAFHGGVFLEQFTLDTPQIWAAAFEVVTGLVIGGVFIAMLVQRFFGK